MDYENTNWWRIPDGKLIELMTAIEKQEKLWLAAQFGQWELQSISCTTCPGDVEKIWNLWQRWYQEKIPSRLAKISGGEEELTRDSLELLVVQNVIRFAVQDPQVLKHLPDKDLKKMLAHCLYYCNVVKAGKNRTPVMKGISTALEIPSRTLHRWIPSPQNHKHEHFG